MNTSAVKYKNVDDYIAKSEPKFQNILQKIRDLIQDVCPEAIESISYGMPAYKLKGKPLIYFAAFSKHLGIYATPDAHEEFKSALANYKQGKGSVQFPLDQPIPYELISEMISFKASLLK